MASSLEIYMYVCFVQNKVSDAEIIRIYYTIGVN